MKGRDLKNFEDRELLDEEFEKKFEFFDPNDIMEEFKSK